MINLARFRSRGFELGFFSQLTVYFALGSDDGECRRPDALCAALAGRGMRGWRDRKSLRGSKSRLVVIGFFFVERASYFEFAEYFHQVTDLDIFERTHGILDLLARFLGRMTSRQLIELRLNLLPGEWSSRCPSVV
jgi:hypothetical protein